MVFYEELVQYPTYKNDPRLITKKWLDAKMAYMEYSNYMVEMLENCMTGTKKGCFKQNIVFFLKGGNINRNIFIVCVIN